MIITVKSQRLHPNAKRPSKSYHADAGWDLYACTDTKIYGHNNLVRTGIALAIPEGYFGLVRDRSGNAKRGLRVSGGVIDAGYRGEVLVLLDVVNNGLDAVPGHEIKAGDRIAQLLVLPVPEVIIEEVESLDTTPRNDKGFNSTGR